MNPLFTLAQGFPANALQPTINQVNRSVIATIPTCTTVTCSSGRSTCRTRWCPICWWMSAYSAAVGHELTGSRNADQPRPGPGRAAAAQSRSRSSPASAVWSRSPTPRITRWKPSWSSASPAGLTFLAAYTWSHFIDDTQTLLDLTGAGIQDAFNRRAEKGNANYDVRHRFVTSYAYELPVGNGKRS